MEGRYLLLLKEVAALREQIELRKQDEAALVGRIEELERELVAVRRHLNQIARGPRSIS